MESSYAGPKKGFTLIELLVVISIIGLLSSIVLASLNVAREKGRMASLRQLEANILHAIGDSASAWWDADEISGTVVRDISGNGNNALYSTNSWTTDTPSGRGSALSFNNAGLANFSTITAYPTSEMTVTAWIRIRAHKNYNHVIQHGWSLEGGWILMTMVNGTAYFGVSKAGNIQHPASGCAAQLTLNSWHLLTGIYDGANTMIYVDGVKCSQSTALASQVLDTISPTQIGSVTTDADIDNVRVYSRAFK